MLTHLGIGFSSSWLTAESTDYSTLARNLLAHGSFRLETGYFAAHHPPLFPLLLAFYYGLAEVLHLPEVAVCSMAAIAWLVAAAYQAYVLVFAFSKKEGQARWAALLVAFQPFLLYASFSPLSEIPFVCLLLFSLLKWWEYKQNPSPSNAIILGLGIGLAMLCRSVFIFGPIFLIIGFLSLRRNKNGWKHALIGLSTCLLVIAPWSVHASIEKGRMVLLSSSAMPGIRDGLSFNHKSHRQALKLPEKVATFSNAFWAEYQSMQSPSDWLKFTVNQPLDQSLTTYLYKALRCWYGTDSQAGNLEKINAAIALIWISAFFLAFKRSKQAQFPPKILGIACLILCLYFWGLATLALSIVRYMVPVFALMALYIPILFSRKA